MRRDPVAYPGAGRMLAFVVVVATAALIALLIHRYGAILMKRLALLTIAAVALTGCNTITQEKVLTNLQGCARYYEGIVAGGLTGGSFSGKVQIDCPPAAPPP